MDEFVKVGTLKQFRLGRGRAVEVDGVRVAVFRTPDGFVAVGDTCPHMGASLADGKLLGKQIECSWHEWKFDVATGASDHREWARVRVYEVRVEGDDVLVRRPPPPDPPPEPPPENDWEVWDPDKHLKKR